MIGKRGNRLYVRVWKDGKNVWGGSFPKTREGKRQAEIKELEMKQEVSAPSKMTGEEFADFWLQNYRRPRRSTNKQNLYAIRPFREDFKDRRISTITRVEARQWAIKHPSAVPTVRAAFNDAVRDDLLPRNPFANLRLPQSRGRKDLTPLTEAELHSLADKAPMVHGEIYGRSVRAMVLFAGYTGVRLGELLAIEWEHVEGNRVRIEASISKQGERTRPKNGKPRKVVLPSPAKDALSDVLRVPDASHVFLTVRGWPMTHTSHYPIWNLVRAAAGLPRMQWHSLRHTCATMFLEAGLSPSDVATQLGHTDGGRLVAELYGHPDQDRARERIDLALDAREQERAILGQGVLAADEESRAAAMRAEGFTSNYQHTSVAGVFK